MMVADIVMFILGSLGYAFRGWIGKKLLSAVFATVRFLLHKSEHELESYHRRKQAKVGRLST